MKQQLTGIIISDKMQKTVVVEVNSLKEHPKYHKRYRVSKSYKAHNESQDCHVGDEVIIEACKPVSKDKRWKVVGKTGKKAVLESKAKEGVEI